jgi:hypothetical protein
VLCSMLAVQQLYRPCAPCTSWVTMKMRRIVPSIKTKSHTRSSCSPWTACDREVRVVACICTPTHSPCSAARQIDTAWREVVAYLLSEKKRTAHLSCSKNPAELLYGSTEDGEEWVEANEWSLRSCATLGVRQLCTGPM